MRNLKFEVRKGSTRTVIVCGLVGPNARRNCVKYKKKGKPVIFFGQKGKQVNIPALARFKIY